MKVLIISHSCVTPINQQFYAEVERQTGWQLTIIAPSNWKTEYGKILNFEPWSEYRGQLIGIPVWLSGNIPIHIYRSAFIRLLQKLQPDFIYVHQEPYAIQTAQIYIANLLSIKKPIGFFTWQNILKFYPFPFQQIEKLVFKLSNIAFPGSFSAEGVLRQKGYEGTSVVLPSGIDPSIYFPRHEASELKTELRKADNEIIIGYLGRIVEEKGLKTLLYALKQIQALPWRLVMVGSGSYKNEFDKIAANLHLTTKISHLGYVPHTEAPLYLSAFDLLVLPSETRSNWKEQFGRVIIEAMACGTPVIGSDSGEIPNLIKATGGGLIFSEGKSEALAEKLKELILNLSLRQELVDRGQKVVTSSYINISLAQSFAESIEKIISVN